MPIKLIIVSIGIVCVVLGGIGLLTGQSILVGFGFGSGTFLFAIGQNT